MTTLSAESGLLARVPPRALRVASVVVVVLAWEIAGRAAPRWASYPTEVAAAFMDNLDRIIDAFVETFKAVGVGYAISVAGGVLIGFGMARIRVVKVALDPLRGGPLLHAPHHSHPTGDPADRDRVQPAGVDERPGFDLPDDHQHLRGG